jgi:hypothetical protein
MNQKFKDIPLDKKLEDKLRQQILKQIEYERLGIKVGRWTP